VNRRAFLSGLVAALAAPVERPEGRRVYSFPSEPTIWTADRLRGMPLPYPFGVVATIDECMRRMFVITGGVYPESIMRSGHPLSIRIDFGLTMGATS
jgi:hypothetical protein